MQKFKINLGSVALVMWLSLPGCKPPEVYNPGQPGTMEHLVATVVEAIQSAIGTGTGTSSTSTNCVLDTSTLDSCTLQ